MRDHRGARRDQVSLAPSHAAALQAELALRLPAHRYTGERANALSGAQHFVTTLYFDTPSHAHLRAALHDPEHNVKLRAKEYYDLHPSLAELATSLAQIVRDQPWLWLELKRREGQRTLKRRVRLAKADAARLFAASARHRRAGARTSDDEREILAYCASWASRCGQLPRQLPPRFVPGCARRAARDARHRARVLRGARRPVVELRAARAHAPGHAARA